MAGGRVSRGRVIVEGFIDFDYEITLLTVRALDRRTARLQTHFCEPIGHVQVQRRLRRELAAAADERPRRAGAHRRSTIAAAPVDGRPRRPGHLRRRAVRQGRRGLVQRGQPAPARHRHGDHGHAAAERVRAACARHPRAAGRHHAREPGRQRGDLRRRRRNRHRVRRRGRRAGGAGHRHPPVRQARELRSSAAWAWRSRTADDVATARQRADRGRTDGPADQYCLPRAVAQPPLHGSPEPERAPSADADQTASRAADGSRLRPANLAAAIATVTPGPLPAVPPPQASPPADQVRSD